MDLNFSPEDVAFRADVKAFIQEKYPPEKRQSKNKHPNRLNVDDIIQWQKDLYTKGWIAPNWPQEYGGTGWTPTQKYIFEEETAKAACPMVIPFGLKMVGPIIYSYGTDEQKKRFLPGILQSTVWWCQGYSEPGSGSDLASLKTNAKREGDYYIVNGSKTWTTYAQFADWIFCLVRTENTGKPQQGISFLLIDMKSEGIEVRPIHTMGKIHSVNEVYFTNVKVPVENLIGEEHQGWTYAKDLLTHERTGIAGVARSKGYLARLKDIIANEQQGQSPLVHDPDFRRKVAELEIDLLALEYTDLRVLSTMSAGKFPGPESSILKIKGSEVQQRLMELFMEASGYYAHVFIPEDLAGTNEGAVGPEFARHSAINYFDYRKVAIYGGSTEIQKNIIAKHVLGL